VGLASLEVAIVNRTLNFILARGWLDYDNFSSKLAGQILSDRPRSEKEIANTIQNIQTSFFDLNRVSVEEFVKNFPVDEIVGIVEKLIKTEPVTFIDVFPETSEVSSRDAKMAKSRLADTPERSIQDALVDSLREKNATNLRERTHDTVLEVADLEHFGLRVNGAFRSFACVVKGYDSIKGKTVTLKDIAHQVMKAYNRTAPDHVILVLAKDLTDSVTSEAVLYGTRVGNPNLVVVCDPVTLTRFLLSRKLI